MSEELAYIAGLLDADGCITIAKYRSGGYMRYCMKAQITNTNKGTLEWIWKLFNCGNMHGIKRENWAEYFTLEWNANDASKILRSLLPYLRIKKAQALLALDFQDRLIKRKFPKKHGLPDSLREERDSVRSQVKQLNGGH